ncbi:phosphoribosyl transferase domain protein [Rhexocercosporidium sp. MPI-PUGE-AT-0058]|nr:phosphoribosyl transferase domain protein [Rhexocercosporidium sp. MPI-PUGE-AT-0058]
MATLNFLKRELRQKALGMTETLRQPLSDSQYSEAFAVLRRESTNYENFIIPQLSELLAPLFNSRAHISVLEIRPGPESVLRYLPNDMRGKIKRYVAYEPNGLFASSLADSLSSTVENEFLFSGFRSAPDIHRTSFEVEGIALCGTSSEDEKFDVVLCCHSLYGMKNKSGAVQKSLGMLRKEQGGGMVVVFHREGCLNLDGLVCHRTASFPTGATRVANDDKTLDNFASFVAGFVMQDVEAEKDIRLEWRKVCRALGNRENSQPDHLSFSSPEIMVAFNQHAISLPELIAQVPLLGRELSIKNREARLHRPACVVRPTDIQQVQACVNWARRHGVGLTVIGGGHSGQCVMHNVVSVDMSAFDNVTIFREEEGKKVDYDTSTLVSVEAGCTTGDIISKTMEAGLTIPLGARPSVGAGLWLQGGIGHLARLHGLACDSIIGAVLVSVASGQVLCIGMVPSQHQPVGSIRPEDEQSLLWALKGAGSNFGIVITVIFKAHPARTYSIRNWVIPLRNTGQARSRLRDFVDLVAKTLPQHCSADAYLYSDSEQLHLGVSVFECSTTKPTATPVNSIFGPETDLKIVDGVGLFDSEMYISGMHGGHSGGKTSSFKRCLLLKQIGDASIARILVNSIYKRPGPLCYLHLLHGGGAIHDVPADTTAFGCRDWDFACVVTGVWPRDQDGTVVAQAAIDWVYSVVQALLSFCSGVYGADLGPDPRDAELAVLAFGPNRPRLARLKHIWDPCKVLAYACPLPKVSMGPKLTVLVTGESCAGKDYCAGHWVTAFRTRRDITARVVSISDVTKQEYARATGADFQRILSDRSYKEKHRPALTAFFQDQVQQRPRLPEEHFLRVVHDNTDVDVLFITGMRDEAPVAVFCHLVPNTKLVEVRVQVTSETRARRGSCDGDGNGNGPAKGDSNNDTGGLDVLDYRPSLIFDNQTMGNVTANDFANENLLPLMDDGFQRLSDMVRSTPDFPKPGIEFQHVLGICQQSGGLALCASLLRSHLSRDWEKVHMVVCCEAGGFIFASALAAQGNKPLALIREAGKLPPPTISVAKCPSHITSLVSEDIGEKRIEMGRDAVRRGCSVVVVDDVLATGKTLVAVLQLLTQAGVTTDDISVIVVAEFPVHRGRELLYRRGFGGIQVQSLLVFGGA